MTLPGMKPTRTYIQDIKFTERASWPGMLLTAAEWRSFDCMDGETQRDFYKWATRETKSEA